MCVRKDAHAFFVGRRQSLVSVNLPAFLQVLPGLATASSDGLVPQQEMPTPYGCHVFSARYRKAAPSQCNLQTLQKQVFPHVRFRFSVCTMYWGHDGIPGRAYVSSIRTIMFRSLDKLLWKQEDSRGVVASFDFTAINSKSMKTNHVMLRSQPVFNPGRFFLNSYRQVAFLSRNDSVEHA